MIDVLILLSFIQLLAIKGHIYRLHSIERKHKHAAKEKAISLHMDVQHLFKKLPKYARNPKYKAYKAWMKCGPIRIPLIHQ